MRAASVLYAFNRGVISPLGLARVDIKRTALSAEIQTNYIPRTLGSMMLRPGSTYLGGSKDDDLAVYLPFIFSNSDTAKLELTDSNLRVWINGAVISRPSVSSAVTNGTFDSNVTGWTDNDESGAVSEWVTGGYLGLTGTGPNFAIRDQQVTVSGGDQGVEHALRIVIARGPVLLRVGSSAGGDQYISETALGTGTHSLAFTPTGNFHIRFSASRKYRALVDSCTVEASGVLVLPTPWLEADLYRVRYDQSADVLFCACYGYQPRRIERRDTRSWSVVLYEAEDGPFRDPNLTPITVASSALSGDVTLTASDPIFKSTSVGGLFRITSDGQEVSQDFTGTGQSSGTVKVTGVGTNRTITVTITGTFVGTIKVERSFDSEDGPWIDVPGWVYTAPVTGSAADGFDNSTVWYRYTTTAWTSGTATAKLSFPLGSITGTARITGFTSETSVSAIVLEDFGGTVGAVDWEEGSWSDRRGWPSSTRLHDGRLWFFGKNQIHGSVSDAFTSYDDKIEGDSGPIKRTIGSGPVDRLTWALSLAQLIAGGEGAEYVARASSLDEPLTPTQFSLKSVSTQGSSEVDAIKVDQSGIFVQRSGSRIYEITLDSGLANYQTSDLTALAPEITQPGIVQLAVQRQPDTRIHAVRSDGKVAILLFDKVEKVTCWVLYETDGAVESAVILPGDEEDQVYYSVRRGTKRYLEKWAKETEAVGGAVNKIADCGFEYSGASTSTITGLGHLEDKTVCVWGNSKSLGTYTVDSGSITLSAAVTWAWVGLPYTATFKSSRLAFAMDEITLGQSKRLSGVGLVLRSTDSKGVRHGQDLDHLTALPDILEGTTIPDGTLLAEYEDAVFPVNGHWTSDCRVCLQSAAPRPCTVLAVIVHGAANRD